MHSLMLTAVTDTVSVGQLFHRTYIWKENLYTLVFRYYPSKCI